ncbi:hypothetical protein GCM10027199_73850 [Amycolatopsis magusensis]
MACETCDRSANSRWRHPSSFTRSLMAFATAAQSSDTHSSVVRLCADISAYVISRGGDQVRVALPGHHFVFER